MRVPRAKPAIIAIVFVASVSFLSYGGAATFSAFAGDRAGPPSGAPPLPTPAPGQRTNKNGGPSPERSYLSAIRIDGPVVLHGTSTTYDWADSVPDPSNGKTIAAEFWISLASDGLPADFVGKYSIDGTVIQTIVENTSSSTTRLGYFIPGEGSRVPTCRVDTRSSPEVLTRTLPQVVIAARLPSSGFVRGGPATPPSLSLTPEADSSVVLRATAAEAWVSVDSQPAMRTITFDLASGRMLGWQSIRRGSIGQILAQHEEAFGPLELITGGGSTSAVALEVIAKGPCNE